MPTTPRSSALRRRLPILTMVLALAVLVVGPASADSTEYYGVGDYTRSNATQTWDTQFDTDAGTMSAQRHESTFYWEADIDCSFLVDEHTLLFGGWQDAGTPDRAFIALKVYDGTPLGQPDDMWIATLSDPDDIAAHCSGDNQAGGHYGVDSGDIAIYVQSEPADADDCKKGGWEDYGFRNQGQCLRFVNTGKDSR